MLPVVNNEDAITINNTVNDENDIIAVNERCMLHVVNNEDAITTNDTFDDENDIVVVNERCMLPEDTITTTSNSTEIDEKLTMNTVNYLGDEDNYIPKSFSTNVSDYSS